MSRSDSFAGLSARGEAVVATLRLVGRTERYGLCNPYYLGVYRSPEGAELREVVQEDVWSGGPTWFTTLEDEAGGRVPGVDWTEQEIADWMNEPYGDALPAIREEDEEFFGRFREAIEEGRFLLCWSDEEKFNRWRASRSGGDSTTA